MAPRRSGARAVRRELGLDEAFLWLAAGRLETVKDYPTLLFGDAEIPEPHGW